MYKSPISNIQMLNEFNIRELKEPHNLLIKTNNLQNSHHHNSIKNSYRIDQNMMYVCPKMNSSKA